MFDPPVTPAKAGAYTRPDWQHVSGCAINSDRAKRMGPGLRRDDGGALAWA